MPSSGEYLRDAADGLIPTRTTVGTIEQLNYIMKTVTNNCSASFYVYAESLFPAALEALISIVDFDEGDVLRFIFRPKGLQRGQHLKGGWARRQAGKVVGLKQLQARKYTSGVRNLWVFDGVIQRALFWMMIADISTNFIYNWSTIAHTNVDCGDGSAAIAATAGPLFTLGGWQSGHYGIVKFSSEQVSTTGGGFTFLGVKGFATAGIELLNTSPTFATTVSIRMQVDTGGGDSEEIASTTIGPGETGSLAVSASVPGSGVVVISLRTEGLGTPTIESGDAFAQGD